MSEEKTARTAALLDLSLEALSRWQPARVTAQADSGGNEVLLYGPIVSDSAKSFAETFLGNETTVSNQSFRDQLAKVSGDVTVRINSPGGDVTQASGIVAALIERRNAGDRINAVVDGLAASAAGFVMLAAHDVRMAPLASVMIHGRGPRFWPLRRKRLRQSPIS